VGCGPIGGLGPRPWASWLVVEGGREQVQSGPSGFDHVVFVWDFTDKLSSCPRSTLGQDLMVVWSKTHFIGLQTLMGHGPK
jgi:hypothetical protein